MILLFISLLCIYVMNSYLFHPVPYMYTFYGVMLLNILLQFMYILRHPTFKIFLDIKVFLNSPRLWLLQ